MGAFAPTPAALPKKMLGLVQLESGRIQSVSPRFPKGRFRRDPETGVPNPECQLRAPQPSAKVVKPEMLEQIRMGSDLESLSPGVSVLFGAWVEL